LRAILPLIADEQTPAAVGVANAAQAYLRDDVPGVLAALDVVDATSPGEPAAYVLRSGILEEHDVDAHIDLLKKAEAAVDAMRAPPHPYDGRDIVHILAHGYERGADALLADIEQCKECRDSPFALIAAADIVSCEHIGRIDLAMKLLDRVIARWPTTAAAYDRKAKLLLREGKTHEAVVVVEAGIAAGAKSPGLLTMAGRAHLAAGEARHAVDDLKEATAKNAGVGAMLALAHAYLLAGDEEARAATIEGLLQTATAAQRCAIATTHGQALLGAARGDAALALFETCFDHSSEAPVEASTAMMAALEAFDALDDGQLWFRLSERAPKVLVGMELPRVVALIAEIRKTANAGDIDGAMKKLTELEALPENAWPPRARRFLLAYVKTAVYPKAGKIDEALAVLPDVRLSCRVRARRAAILIAAKRSSEAEDELQRLIEQASYCREETFQGAYILQALVERAELAVPRDAKRAAAELRDALHDLFPRAEPDGSLMRRAARVLELAGG
jgi:tetratricopeptide (TPR) repeat protein